MPDPDTFGAISPDPYRRVPGHQIAGKHLLPCMAICGLMQLVRATAVGRGMDRSHAWPCFVTCREPRPDPSLMQRDFPPT